ncbi:hypothetical protein SOCE26_043680 [Sorangium cellulosum]|uniref:Uncharacterized protein n=1 Tax=Sorangium cellulosum TaxID=56 RepID=A0A2L0EUE7_SORCE|nr:hypothetical protein [Sorangium cellulosum]AUX42928.1 hypothetical protein SOCE26_043680 [Sorangium cellulosum]
MTQAVGRPSSGARYVLEQSVDEGAQREGRAPGEVVYRGLVRLPDADIPVEVRVAEETGAATATVDVAAVPHGGPRPEDLARTAAALVRSATKAADVHARRPPRKIVRWRG